MRAFAPEAVTVEVEGPSGLALPELRTGEWTRFGSAAVLGDAVTEATLSTLAESTRSAARSQGYSVGWAEGVRAAREVALAERAEATAALARAEERRADEHAAALTALREAAERLHTLTTEACARIEEQASTLAWELVTELVGHELATGHDVVRRVLALAPTEPVAVVRLHPADVPAAVDAGLQVVADPTLQPGDALVEAAEHVLDLRIGTALERVREVLA